MTFTVGSGLSKQACRPPCQLRVSPRAEDMVVGVGGGLALPSPGQLWVAAPGQGAPLQLSAHILLHAVARHPRSRQRLLVCLGLQRN